MARDVMRRVADHLVDTNEMIGRPRQQSKTGVGSERSSLTRFAAAFVVALAAVGSCSPGTGRFAESMPVFWRDGPVKIEAQIGEKPQPIAVIVYIDAAGFAYRDGVPIDALDRADLLQLTRDLIDYEVALSWPPEQQRRRRRIQQ